MPEALSAAAEILRVKVLGCFLNEEPAMCTVTRLARLLGEGKQRISRLLIAMEKDGLLDRSNVRKPRLTALGKEQAVYYEERKGIILNHLLYEGVDMDSAEQDANVLALCCSEASMRVIRRSEQRDRAKYELRRRKRFDGEVLSRHLEDGEYFFTFLIYRERAKDGDNLSMANEGFRHPCSFVVKDGVGTVRLKAVAVSARSRLTGEEMRGRVRDLRYQMQGEFRQAWQQEDWLCFPAKALSFLNLGSENGQILHGSVPLRMQCSVGTGHMPEATAIFTMIL